MEKKIEKLKQEVFLREIPDDVWLALRKEYGRTIAEGDRTTFPKVAIEFLRKGLGLK